MSGQFFSLAEPEGGPDNVLSGGAAARGGDPGHVNPDAACRCATRTSKLSGPPGRLASLDGRRLIRAPPTTPTGNIGRTARTVASFGASGRVRSARLASLGARLVIRVAPAIASAGNIGRTARTVASLGASGGV